MCEKYASSKCEQLKKEKRKKCNNNNNNNNNLNNLIRVESAAFPKNLIYAFKHNNKNFEKVFNSLKNIYKQHHNNNLYNNNNNNKSNIQSSVIHEIRVCDECEMSCGCIAVNRQRLFPIVRRRGQLVRQSHLRPK